MAKNKGFGKQQQPAEDGIYVQSLIGSRQAQPLVELRWGNKIAQFSPAEARDHAAGIFEAAASAEIDSTVFKWASQELGMSAEQAAYLRALFKSARQEREIPRCTMQIDGKQYTPEQARAVGLEFLFMAFTTEMEVFLAQFLFEQVGANEEAVNVVIERLREMRGLKRIDEIEIVKDEQPEQQPEPEPSPDQMFAIQWQSYDRSVLAAGAPAVQRSETKRAFYAGGAMMLSLIRRIDTDNEDAAIAALEALEREFRQFLADVEAESEG